MEESLIKNFTFIIHYRIYTSISSYRSNSGPDQNEMEQRRRQVIHYFCTDLASLFCLHSTFIGKAKFRGSGLQRCSSGINEGKEHRRLIYEGMKVKQRREYRTM